MKNSIIIVLLFCLGVIVGVLALLPRTIVEANLNLYILLALLFFIGIGIGANRESLKILKAFNLKILLVPLATIIGTLTGSALASLFLPDLNLRDSVAVGAGFGWYSLSSVMIAEISSKILGVIALISNISREIITLLVAPLFAKIFGKLAPISAGGATSMDSTLPIITKCTGKEYALISVFHGLLLTLVVPFLIRLILSL